MRLLILMNIILLSAACAPVPVQEIEKRDYQRVDYYQSVYLPLERACSQAGGYMVFEEAASPSPRHAPLSYAEMRLAVMRGCAGI